jgi:tripartite-type tricarboxylate transporter receptor subunit TctC
VTSPERLVAALDLPIARETLPDMVSRQLIGLFAPAGTPSEIIEQIAEANHAALAELSYQRMLVETGFEPDIDSSPRKFQRLIEAEIAKWTPIVTSLGIKID